MKPSSKTNNQTQAKLINIWPDKIELDINNNIYELKFKNHPWFKNKNQNDLENVREIVSGHFYWPTLDIDLTEDMIFYPDKYPMLDKFQNAKLYDKLQFLPENTLSEIIEGKLILSPRPANKHILAASYLGALLLGHYVLNVPQDERKWFFADEPEVRFNNHIVVPDLAGWKSKNLPKGIHQKPHFTDTPDWICEVTSPSTEKLDRNLKFKTYAESGINYYWILNPMDKTLEVFQLEKTTYKQVSCYQNNDTPCPEPFSDLKLSLTEIFNYGKN